MIRFLIVLSVFISGPAYADVPASQVGEVAHLLNFVTTSQCVIDRNGDKYSGVEGVVHIQRKYDYFRDEIKSAEDFIRFSATKSTMSGKYYTVICPGEKSIKTEDWLLVELKRFRENKK